jgi:Ferritin-like domain
MFGQQPSQAGAGADACFSHLAGVIALEGLMIPCGEPAPESAATGLPRADFLKIIAVAGGAAMAGRVLTEGKPNVASAAGRSPSQDRDILAFLLQLEYLQAALYKEAKDKGALSGDLARFATVAADHEQAHVSSLRRLLGGQAPPVPHFSFGNTSSDPARFASVAMRLEELAVGAYVGQGANLTRGAVLRVARIASVEGRHAAWVRDIQRELPAPDAADRALDQSAISAALSALGFSE